MLVANTTLLPWRLTKRVPDRPRLQIMADRIKDSAHSLRLLRADRRRLSTRIRVSRTRIGITKRVPTKAVRQMSLTATRTLHKAHRARTHRIIRVLRPRRSTRLLHQKKSIASRKCQLL